VSNPERTARRLLRWYPRSWRETHEAEFLALLEDSISDRPFWPGRFFSVAANGVRLRSVELGGSPRRVLFSSSAATVVIVLVMALVTNGFGLFSSPGPSKGRMPYDPPGGPTYKSIPDYVAVYVNAHTTGYTPKAYVAAPSGARNAPLLGRAAPVYASNLTTLLGHEYPGIGFVPLGQSPWAQPCRTESSLSTSANGAVTTSTLPCPSVVLVLPNVAGMVTPTAVGELSGLGVDVVIVNVRSKSVLPGHIVGTSPRGGAKVHGRQPILVYISTR
jgi:PASTA domain